MKEWEWVTSSEISQAATVLTGLEEPQAGSYVPGLMNFIYQGMISPGQENGAQREGAGSPGGNEESYKGHNILDAFWGETEKERYILARL